MQIANGKIIEIRGRGALANSLGPGLPWHLAVPGLLLPGLAPDFI